MKANICATFDDFEAADKGAIYYFDDGAANKCPGCGKECFLAERHDNNHPSWEIDRATNTLSPSVNHNVEGCGWHGWLRNGEWVLA